MPRSTHPQPTHLEADDAGNLRLIVRTARQPYGRFDLGQHVTSYPRWWKRLKPHLMRDWQALEDLHHRDLRDAAECSRDDVRDWEHGYRMDTKVTT